MAAFGKAGIFAFAAECLLDVWIETNGYSYRELPYLFIKEFPRAFYLQFRGEDVFKAIMLDEQEFPTYDIEGGMTSTVKFLRVNDFSIDSYNASKLGTIPNR